MASKSKAPSSLRRGGREIVQCRDDNLKQLYPQLHDHLTVQVYEDGEVREVSVLSVFTKNGLWKLSLSDKNSSEVCFVSAETYDMALKTLEDSLESGRADWILREDRSKRNAR